MRKYLYFISIVLIIFEKESFGLSALEAMAHGVPIISSDAGGIPEVNKHGKTGYLSKIGDTESMTLNALSLLQNESLHESFKKQAEQQAEKFNLESVVNQYESIYADAIETV